MPAISSLVKTLKTNHPELTFQPGEFAHWSASTQTVFYDTSELHGDWILLHETSHALLRHTEYMRDIDLLKIERQAWSYAINTLAPRYGIEIDPDFIETQIDTYRDWLHVKSTCPSCQSNGIEARKHTYTCLHCGSSWHTNTGIEVGVRRYISA